MTEYQKVLEQFRTHYHNEYGINLDDEVLYFFVRVNEMQSDLKKDIRNLPKITFKTRWDYFFYGLSKWFIPSLIFTITLIGITIFYVQPQSKNSTGQIIIKNSIPYLEIKTDSLTYYLPIQKK
ncbi:MAG: hypothetical protein M3Z26_06495 [Bacteroidota bacterium]|nr:hypothetical protein [Bacteroidota bacterium]